MQYFHNRINSEETGLYDTVTVGAMTAHSYKYKNGFVNNTFMQFFIIDSLIIKVD